MKKVLVTCHVGRHYRKFGQYDIIPLLELGYEVHFAANFNLEIDKVKDEKINLHQIDFSRNPFSLRNIKAYKQIKEVIDHNNFDVIHCQSPVGGVITRLAVKKARKKGTKVIYTAHGFHFYKGASIINWILFYPIEKKLSKYCDIIITINSEDYNFAKKHFKKTNIIHINGVGLNPQKFKIRLSQKEKKELRQKIGLKEEDFIITYVAEISKNKNQKWLIKEVKTLIEKNKNIHLLLIGNDLLNGKCQNLVKKLNLDKNIHFLGFRTDIPQLLKISNMAISASKREGLPVNIMEAMCNNLAIVALECRGVSELIKNGINGFCVTKKNNDMIEKIEKIYNNKIEYKILEKYNKENITKYYTEEVKKDVNKIYESITFASKQ